MQGKIFEKMSDFLQEIEFVTFFGPESDRVPYHRLMICHVLTPYSLRLHASTPD